MLNRRIKSLLVTGLLMVGMSGSVFAEGNGNDGCIPGLRGIHEGDQHKIEKVTVADWEAYMNQINTTNTGFVIEPQQKNWKDKAAGNSEGWIEFKVYKDEDFDHEKDDNHQIEVIHIKFNKELSDKEKEEKAQPPVVPQPPVTPPTLPETEPETGDAGIMPIVVTAVASAACLFVLNKKDDEE